MTKTGVHLTVDENMKSTTDKAKARTARTLPITMRAPMRVVCFLRCVYIISPDMAAKTIVMMTLMRAISRSPRLFRIDATNA